MCTLPVRAPVVLDSGERRFFPAARMSPEDLESPYPRLVVAVDVLVLEGFVRDGTDLRRNNRPADARRPSRMRHGVRRNGGKRVQRQGGLGRGIVSVLDVVTLVACQGKRLSHPWEPERTTTHRSEWDIGCAAPFIAKASRGNERPLPRDAAEASNQKKKATGASHESVDGGFLDKTAYSPGPRTNATARLVENVLEIAFAGESLEGVIVGGIRPSIKSESCRAGMWHFSLGARWWG
ncbi:hypothetical protein JB92DRAFT_3098451 [Gautieria morchelliformis]|nr:hypothetical protein JB92DRAFT_3098451 [Gautieria morchelliformis]